MSPIGQKFSASAELGDAIGRHELRPDRVRLVVARNARLALEDRRVEAIGGSFHTVGQQLPRERNRVLLK